MNDELNYHVGGCGVYSGFACDCYSEMESEDNLVTAEDLDKPGMFSGGGITPSQSSPQRYSGMPLGVGRPQ